nr:Vacuolar-processing enzyme [Ipomoea batatas]
MGVSSYITLKVILVLAVLVVAPPCGAATDRLSTILRSAVDKDGEDENSGGTKWAVLVAGSNEYWNYRHQSDVCHAYQLLKKGGLKDENIIVFMYDDIANNEENPRKGVIINSPNGSDVYAGVPKDYTGEEVNTDNFFAVLLGNKSAVVGGSGKVLNTKNKDVIFIYYADHGAPGYVAANTEESSWGWYCPGEEPAPPPEYTTKKERIEEQFERVKYRTFNNGTEMGSHVKEYGNMDIRKDKLSKYQGYVPADSASASKHCWVPPTNNVNVATMPMPGGVHQRDAELLYLWEKYKRLGEKSEMKEKVLKEIGEKMQLRAQIDGSVAAIGDYLFGTQKAHSILKSVRKTGPLVDDWECLRSMVKIFEEHCGALGEYGRKHMRAFANICNNAISLAAMGKASMAACDGHSAQ